MREVVFEREASVDFRAAVLISFLLRFTMHPVDSLRSLRR